MYITTLYKSISFRCLVVYFCVAQAAIGSVESLSDADIEAAIESEFLVQDGVDANTLDTQSDNGVVTLSGTVNNLLQSELAVSIAESMKGVRAVINRIEVVPLVPHLTDEGIREAVIDGLKTDPATDAYEVGVSVAEGVVTLTGWVDSWAERQLSGSVAKGVRGVKALNNEIQVVYKSKRPDSEIEKDIEAQLANDVKVDDLLISVQVNEGNAELSGIVGSLAEKRRANMHAWVAGVESVEDGDLNIEWWLRDRFRRKNLYATRTDEEIERAVNDVFVRDPRVAPWEFDVRVSEGTVILSGVVDNLRTKRVAEMDTRNVVGVQRVKNLIKVRPKETISDEDLRIRIVQAFTNDPVVEGYDLSVHVNSGRVTLRGQVNNSYEKQRAGSVVHAIKGVTDVVNRLDYVYEWTWRPDWVILENIKEQLYWSPFVDQDQVAVQVERGVATLRGHVETWSERQTAEVNAWEGGAKDVRNMITVTYRVQGPYFWDRAYDWPYELALTQVRPDLSPQQYVR